MNYTDIQTIEARPQYLVTVGHLFAILRARWLSVVACMVIALGLGVAASLLMPKKYTATATLLVDVKAPDPVSGLVLQGMMSPSYMNTQVDLITGDPVAKKVVRELKLAESAELVAKWREATKGEGDFGSWLAKFISDGLVVTPARDSNIIQVGFISADPRFAAAAANATVNAYLNTVLELRVEPAKQYKQFFDANATKYRSTLEEAQKKLTDYQREHGITSSENQIDVDSIRLQELSSQLVVLQAQASDSESRTSAGNVSIDKTQDALNNPLIGSLRADLQRSRAKLNEISANLGDNNPQVIQLKQSIAELENRVAEETRRVHGGISMSTSVNNRRIADVRASIEVQREKVLRSKAIREDAAVLRRDVENAQRAYDAVLSRASEMNLQSQVNQTNVSVVGVADAPTEPSSPKVVRNIASASVLGLLIGLAWALVREAKSQRIRTDLQFAAIVGQPVSLTLPNFSGRKSDAHTPRLGSPAAHRIARLTSK